MKPQRLSRWLAISASAWLAGCATPAGPYAYAVKATDPKLIFRSVGMPMNVDFSVAYGEKPCENYQRVCTVRDAGREVLLSWIADMSEKFNKTPAQLEIRVPENVAVYLKGESKWFGPNTKGSCGPLEFEFTADASHTYLVEFVWSGASTCKMRISDTTSLFEPRDVLPGLFSCPRPLF